MQNIVILDDNEGILASLSLLLEEYGYKAHTADKPEGFIELLQNTNPSLIIIDMFLGSYNGVDIAREIKENPHLKSIPILLLSANNQARHYIHESLIDAFIAKPFEIDEIITTIEELIDQKKSLKTN